LTTPFVLFVPFVVLSGRETAPAMMGSGHGVERIVGLR